jgi:hypothetical protein
VHDAIEFERMGIPSVVIVSTEFEALGRAFATSVGAPDYPFVVVPHPVATLADAKVRALAERFVDEVVGLLTNDGDPAGTPTPRATELRTSS